MTALAHHPLDRPFGPFTVEDWKRLDPREDGSRLELIWGHFHVTPPPSGQHQHANDELRALLKGALREFGRTDLYPVTGVGIEVSTQHRQAFVPDLSVLTVRPIGNTFQPDDVAMVVEVISPGNTRKEQEDKFLGYADAGIEYYWVVRQLPVEGRVSVTAYRLKGDRYVEDAVAEPGRTVTITAAPVPVTFDPAVLSP